MESFIRCGFEFTAAPKKSGIITNENLIKSKKDVILLKACNDKIISNYNWINNNFKGDVCGCEIPTPIITQEVDVVKYFEQFRDFINSSNLTININESLECLGGCHIHMNMANLSKKAKNRFLINAITLFTNYPELNWAFNDPNDNWNANSLLSRMAYLSDLFISPKDFIRGESSYNFVKKELRKGKTDFVLSDNSNLFRALDNPMKNLWTKDYGIRYSEKYDTIEFRFFDMPSTLGRHLLHYYTAKAIYNYCMNFDRKLSLDYLNFNHYDFDVKYSISRFHKVMELLNVNSLLYDYMSVLEDNIKTRYKWTKESHDNYLA